MEKLMIDSDVLINWLSQESEKHSGKRLWIAPATILELGETRQIDNHISLISLFEIRFVLRRKKNIAPEGIEQDLNLLSCILNITIPSKDTLSEANQLQSEHELDPFDSIVLAQAISLNAGLISRDRRFLGIAGKYISNYSPEEYIERSLG